MSGSILSIAGRGGAFTGYLARPGLTGRGPGVIVLQEIFGVNTNMRQICDDLARAGYVALCPDLFWRIEPGLSLTDATDEEWGRAFELYKAFDVDAGIEDVGAAIAALRGHEACTGKVGAVGYCLGGLLAFLTATRTDVDASVGYYGVGIQDRLGEADRISAPVMLHIAGKDQFVPPAAQKQIADGLAAHRHVTLHHYPERDHAFAREGGAHWHATDAAAANAATAAFFERHLKR